MYVEQAVFHAPTSVEASQPNQGAEHISDAVRATMGSLREGK